jgi:hypothetical protein
MGFGGNVFEPNPPVEVAEEAEKRKAGDAALEGDIAGVEATANVAVAGVEGIWHPSNSGWRGWTFDPLLMFEGQIPDLGIADTTAVAVPSSATLKKVTVYFEKVGKELTAAQNFIAVYDSVSGNRLALSADLTAEFENATNENTMLTIDLGVGFTVPSGIAYVPILTNGKTGVTLGSYTEGKATTYKDPRYTHSPEGKTSLPAKFGELGAMVRSGDSHWIALS